MSAPIVFHRRIYAANRLMADRTGGDSFLVRQASDNLAERLSGMNRRFRRALDLGSRPTSFAILSPLADHWVRTRAAPGDESAALVTDEEFLPFAPGSFDLIVSVLTLHAVNDLPGVLIQIRRALTPDGLFLAALLGGATLQELRHAFAAGESEATGGASPHVAPFADVRDMGALLQRAGFTMPVSDVERVSVRYRAFASLVEDLRALGETNALAQRRRSMLSRRTLAATLAHYAAHDADAEGRLNATFDIVYVTGWGGNEGR
jgi:SAM-dependent methyltransferase